MPSTTTNFFKSLPLTCALFGCLLPPVLGQQEPAQPQADAVATAQDDEETIRIDTELIQTGVMVFDKSGKFVEGLRQEDFELSVEGSPRPIAFFDRVTAAPSAASSSSTSRAAKGAAATAAPVLAAGGARTVIIFADDLHLSFEDRKRARDL